MAGSVQTSSGSQPDPPGFGIRRDATHKLTHRLGTTYGTVAVERLHVAGIRNRRLARAPQRGAVSPFASPGDRQPAPS
jgi:hypothetical protein